MEYFEGELDRMVEERKEICKLIESNLRFIDRLLDKVKIKEYTLNFEEIHYKFKEDNRTKRNIVEIFLFKIIKTKKKTEKKFYKHLVFDYRSLRISQCQQKIKIYLGLLTHNLKYKGKDMFEYLKPFWVDFEKTKEIVYRDLIQMIQIPETNKRFCGVCNNQLSDEEARFCSRCGAKV